MRFFDNFKFREIKDRLLYYGKGLWERAAADHIFLLSGGLSFSLFTCILPLILILFSLFGILLELPGVKAQVNQFLVALVPYPESADFLKEIIFNRIEDFRVFKTISGSLGIVGLFFAASGLFSSIRSILNAVYKITESRRFYLAKLRDLGMVLLVVSFFLVSMAILPALDFIPPLLQKLDFGQLKILDSFWGGLVSAFMSVFSFCFIFFMFFLIYYLFPYGRSPAKMVLISSFWAAFLWLIAKELFGYYIAHAALLSRIYGAYVFLVIVAFWIYYSSLILILGAEIGQLFRERKESVSN